MPTKDQSIDQSLALTTRLLTCFQAVQKAAKDGKQAARAQSAVVQFVKALQEKIEGPGSAAVCRVHQPKSVEFGEVKAESYTDVGTRLAVDAYQVIVDTIDDPDKDFCDMPGYLEEPERVAAEWPAIAKQLTKSGLIKLDLDKLLSLIKQEHEQAKPVQPKLPFVYQTKKKAIPAQVNRVGKKGKPKGMTDVITFAPGEPAQRYDTKIGGVPFRAAEVPWPTTAEGKPMTFVAQFCFADSEDLVDPLPGQVLLIFGNDEHFCYPSSYGDEGQIAFEWYPLADFPLIKPKDVPATAWKIDPCHGTVERQSERKGAIESAKIGGRPVWLQHDLGRDGFLCTLQGQADLLRIADAGVLNFFLRDDSRIVWMIDSY